MPAPNIPIDAETMRHFWWATGASIVAAVVFTVDGIRQMRKEWKCHENCEHSNGCVHGKPKRSADREKQAVVNADDEAGDAAHEVSEQGPEGLVQPIKNRAEFDRGGRNSAERGEDKSPVELQHTESLPIAPSLADAPAAGNVEER
jgi:uncharacterized Fe-S cluster protein YjdI